LTNERIKTIATLGPRGTYSEKAARQLDMSARIVFCRNIPDVVEAVLAGKEDVAVVPIENSLEGSVNVTLDLLRENKLSVIGEINVHVVHCLVMKGKKEDVTMIYSHSQALAQCRKYLRENFPNAQIYETTSTADAANKASLAKHIAAIASKEAANEYGLKIFAKNIQDVNENYTRFIVIGKNIPEPTGNDKTSIIVYPKENKFGALYEILGVFAKRGIDLTKVESRTTKKALGDYLFHIDLNGHVKDKIVAAALEELREIVQMLKILGSYPKA